jgi:hypothetical protein
MTNEPAETPPGLRFPDSDDFPTGPAIGAALPDFTLTDQHGAAVSLAAARGDRRALLVFLRSTRW